MSRTEKNWDAVMYACDLTEDYVDFNKGDVGGSGLTGRLGFNRGWTRIFQRKGAKPPSRKAMIGN